MLTRKSMLLYMSIFAASQSVLAIPHAASQYCQDNGGEITIRTTSQGQEYGVCVWSEGVDCDYGQHGDRNCVFIQQTECEEWSYYKHTCERGSCQSVSAELNEKGELVTQCVPLGT